MSRILDYGLCLGAGLVCGAVAWALAGDMQPGYLMVAFAAGAIVTSNILDREER